MLATAGAIGEKLADYLVASRASEGRSEVLRGILVDTCAWVDYLRTGATPLSRTLDRLLQGEQLFTCGQVMAELLQGVRSEADRAAVLSALGTLEYLEMNPKVWMRTAGLSSALRGAGKQVPQSDAVIAALALEHGLAVLTEDRHFKEFPGLVLYEVSG